MEKNQKIREVTFPNPESSKSVIVNLDNCQTFYDDYDCAKGISIKKCYHTSSRQLHPEKIRTRMQQSFFKKNVKT